MRVTEDEIGDSG